jgi:PPK2 family polyphosphate:nucleotide phosphotransferase
MATGFWKDNPAELLRVRKGFDLRTVDPDATPGTKKGREAGEDELEESAQELRELQEKLYAQSKVGGQLRMLVVLQAVDAAGKGGIVNHVFSHVEPYGLALTSFKAPTAEERAHDFLWRIEPHVPGPGMIGVFDRSHYEDVLIQRVRSFAPPGEIERRYGAISDFEKRIWDKGVKIVKIMLHISPQEQEKRLLARLDNPEKHWKYNTGDLNERLLWPAYMDAFQIAIERTHTEFAPWFVVPANAKWYARAAVQRIVISELSAMDLQWPVGDFDVERERQRVAQSADLRWP